MFLALASLVFCVVKGWKLLLVSIMVNYALSLLYERVRGRIFLRRVISILVWVNGMLDDAILELPAGEHPVVHSDRTLNRADLLILDELSSLSFNRHQSELLFKVIFARSEQSSTIVTTNLLRRPSDSFFH